VTTEALNVEGIRITDVRGLDPIDVIWQNYGAGSGSVAITCFGCAWTAWFGAMGGRTIQEFFADADVSYLVTKLGITPLLKQRKNDHAYLDRIIRAVKDSLRPTPGGAA
jgi:hypothetical protein